MIAKEIKNFVKECISDYEDFNMSMKEIDNSKIIGNQTSGSGFCIKIKTSAFTHENAGDDKVMIEFTVSDGEYSIPCVCHNAEENYLEGSMTDDRLTQMLDILTRSQKQGKRIEVNGNFVNYGRKRIFVVQDAEIDEGLTVSQMTDKQFKKFKSLCKKHKTNPFELMMSDETLWAELYAKKFLKMAILLFCLSPTKKQDMIHIGVVSSHGEGKDHLVERVIQPLVPCRRAGSGKMATIPGLFGAMSGDDLNAIEVGLLPKMNHERVAVSEFQTWHEDTFGELMNMMANGKIEMQKGALDVERETTLNILFLGNPPANYNEGKHDKRVMLDVFGKYTFQIVSRLTLIFTQLSLANGEAQDEIRDAIISAMDEDFTSGEGAKNLNMWRTFFREYLRYVSLLKPKLRDEIPMINSTYDEIEARPQFKDAFCVRTATDNRKYQEFANLVRGIARLYGDENIDCMTHLVDAKWIFEESLQTLTEKFNTKHLSMNLDSATLNLFEKILKECPVAKMSEIKKKTNATAEQIEKLISCEALTKDDEGQYWADKKFLQNTGGESDE